MAGFFPRDVVHWADEHLHPLRAFSLRTIELAGLTGVIVRVFRALVLGATRNDMCIGFRVAARLHA